MMSKKSKKKIEVADLHFRFWTKVSTGSGYCCQLSLPFCLYFALKTLQTQLRSEIPWLSHTTATQVFSL